jgi:hypothetical protein
MGDSKSRFLCLVKIQSPEGERVHLVEKSTFFIGRSTESDILYPHLTASRKHLEVTIKDDIVTIKDLNSANGTLVNNISAPGGKEIAIDEDDEVIFGTANLRISFQTIPRPVEMKSLDEQKKILQKSMGEVIRGLTKHAKDEFESTIKPDLEQTKASLTQNLHDEISQQRKVLLEKLAQEGNELKSKQAAELESNKNALFSILSETAQKIDANQKKITHFEETHKDEIEAARAKVIQELESYRQEHIKALDEEKQKLLTEREQFTIQVQNLKEQMLEVIDQLEKLKSEADQYVAETKEQARVQADEELNELRKKNVGQIESYKKELETEVQRLQAEIHEKSLQARSSSEKMAEQLVNESRDRIAKEEADCTEKVASLLRQAQVKLLESSKESYNKSEEIIQVARTEAHEMRTQSQSDANQIRKKALDQAEDILKQARTNADEQIQSINAEQLKRLKHEEQEALKKIESLAAKQQEDVLLHYQEKFNAFNNQLTDLENSKNAIVTKNTSLQEEIEKRTAQLDKLDQNMQAKTSEHEKLIKNLTHAESILQSAEAAKLEIEKLAKESRAIEFQIEFQKKAAVDVQGELAAAHKTKQEDLLIQHQTSKKNLEQELNQQRLKALDDIKKKIEEEEKHIKEVRKQQASEIASGVESRMAAKLKSYVKDPTALGKLSQDIFATVRETLMNDETNLKPITAHLEESKAGKVEVRKKRYKILAASASAVCVLVMGMNREQIMSFIRLQDKNSAAQQMINQRHIQSIYDPAQTPEFRDTYMDNVLYMKNYYPVVSSSDFQQKWTLRLNDLNLIKELKINEDQMVKFIAAESSLVSQLYQLRQSIDAVYLSEGLERMRKLEEQEKPRLLELLKTEQSLARIHQLEKQFLADYMLAHSREFP